MVKSVDSLRSEELACSYEIWVLVYFVHLKIYVIAGTWFTATLDSQQLVSWEWKEKLAQGKDQPGVKRKTGWFSYFLSLYIFVKASSHINVWQEKSQLVLPLEKDTQLGWLVGLGMFAVQLVTLMPSCAVWVSPLTRLPPCGWWILCLPSCASGVSPLCQPVFQQCHDCALSSLHRTPSVWLCL